MLAIALEPTMYRQLDAGFYSFSLIDQKQKFKKILISRILEMEQEFRINNRHEKSEIELWDCSGDLK